MNFKKKLLLSTALLTIASFLMLHFSWIFKQIILFACPQLHKFFIANSIFVLCGPIFSTTSAGAFGFLIATILRVFKNSGIGVGILIRGAYLPTFCSALSWNYNNWVIRVGIPVMCILLFIAHPEGHLAWTYSLYWLIPIIIHFFKRKSIFFTALSSNLIAHAVGSVIWIYTLPLSHAYFIALIPIVFIERIITTICAVLIYNQWHNFTQSIQKNIALSIDISSAYLKKQNVF